MRLNTANNYLPIKRKIPATKASTPKTTPGIAKAVKVAKPIKIR